MFDLRGKTFFDSPKVKNAMDKTTHKALSKFGAYVMTVARNSMKKAAASAPPSEPGSPPRAREGHLRRFLFFSYDRRTQNVIIGPELLSGQPTDPTIPELHEFGGAMRPRRRRGTLRKYPARPYMQSAFEKGQEKLDEFWAQAIVKTL